MNYNNNPYNNPYNTESVQVQVTVADIAYVKSPSGIIKITQMVLSCIVLICVASVSHFSSYSSGGWVNFVASITLLTAFVLFLLYLFDLFRKLPGPWVIIEFCLLVFCTLFWLIAMIVSATSTHGGGATAAAVFSAITAVAFIIDLVMRFRIERSGNSIIINMSTRSHIGGMNAQGTTVTTTTTSATAQSGYVAGEQGPVAYETPNYV